MGSYNQIESAALLVLAVLVSSAFCFTESNATEEKQSNAFLGYGTATCEKQCSGNEKDDGFNCKPGHCCGVHPTKTGCHHWVAYRYMHKGGKTSTLVSDDRNKAGNPPWRAIHMTNPDKCMNEAELAAKKNAELHFRFNDPICPGVHSTSKAKKFMVKEIVSCRTHKSFDDQNDLQNDDQNDEVCNKLITCLKKHQQGLHVMISICSQPYPSMGKMVPHDDSHDEQSLDSYMFRWKMLR